MDFDTALETFREAWAAANIKGGAGALDTVPQVRAEAAASSAEPAETLAADTPFLHCMRIKSSPSSSPGRSPSPPPSGSPAPPTGATTAPACAPPAAPTAPAAAPAQQRASTPASARSPPPRSPASSPAAAATPAAATPAPAAVAEERERGFNATGLAGMPGLKQELDAKTTGEEAVQPDCDVGQPSALPLGPTPTVAPCRCSKSLPVHCVVEAVCSVEPKLGAKLGLLGPKRPVVEADSYVIVPAATAFDDLVPVALAQLGYARDAAAAATGSVVIKNWKPLSFDKIADGPLVSVGDILGELTTVATLRIQIFRSRPSVLGDMRDKLLRMLLSSSRSALASSGCPLDEVTLSQLCRCSAGAGGDRLAEPPEDVRRKFEHWWSLQQQQQQQQQQQPGPPQRQQQQPGPPSVPSAVQQQQPPQQQQMPRRTPSPRHRPHLSPASGLALYAGDVRGHGGHGGHGGPTLGGGPLGAGALDAVALSHKLMHDVHPALQTVQSQYPTPKTRMRTSFDPELELPKLQRWFAENQHPSRQQIQQYVRELNSLESRRGRKPLDVNNVVYWFKNARAAQKRAEIRGTGPAGGHYLSQNGYNSNSHSPPGSGAPPHFLSPETLLTEGPGPHAGPAVGPGGRLLPMGAMALGGMPPWPLSSPPMAHMHRPPHADLPRPRSVVSDDSDGEGGGPVGAGGAVGPGGQQDDDGDLHGDRNSPISLIINRDAKDDKDKDREQGDELGKEPKDSDLDVTNDDSRMSIKQEPGPGDDDVASTGHNNNNNNNNHVKDCEAMSDMDDDEDEEDDGSEGGGGGGGGVDLQQQQQQQLERYHHHHHHNPHGFRSPSPCGPPCGPPGPGGLPFPMFGHSIMYMSQYLPGLAAAHPAGQAAGGPGQQQQQQQQGLNLSASDERRKRNRTFIDPVSEVPRLEQWFKHHTHPPHNLILKYTEELNHMPYRCKFPRLEPKNVQFWFKNRRAKDKRMKVSLFDNGPQSNHQQGVYHGQHSELALKRE